MYVEEDAGMSLSNKPIQPAVPSNKARRFQDRVDYVAKALRRGSWGRQFNSCFESYDGEHVIAVVMRRAENNASLKASIMAAFETRDWKKVPWHAHAKAFAHMTPREIGLDAERVREARLMGINKTLFGVVPLDDGKKDKGETDEP